MCVCVELFFFCFVLISWKMEWKEKKENTLYSGVEVEHSLRLLPLTLYLFSLVRHGIKIIIKIYVDNIHLSSIPVDQFVIVMRSISMPPFFIAKNFLYRMVSKMTRKKLSTHSHTLACSHKAENERRIKEEISLRCDCECVCVCATYRAIEM